MVDPILIDGSALVNMLKPSANCKTFSDYANLIYLPYIKKQLLSTQRVDVIWDRYIEHSLKVQTRSKRRAGIRRRVEPDVKLPGNWADFLRVESNKSELFHYLAEETFYLNPEGKVLLSTQDTLVKSTSTGISSLISPCTHEEADTRLLLHASDCASNGHGKLMVRTVDTDVVVLSVANFSSLNIVEMWIAFGVGKQFRYIAIHDIVNALG